MILHWGEGRAPVIKVGNTMKILFPYMEETKGCEKARREMNDSRSKHVGLLYVIKVACEHTGNRNRCCLFTMHQALRARCVLYPV